MRAQVGGSLVTLTVDRGQPVAAGAVDRADRRRAISTTRSTSAQAAVEVGRDGAGGREERSAAHGDARQGRRARRARSRAGEERGRRAPKRSSRPRKARQKAVVAAARRHADARRRSPASSAIARPTSATSSRPARAIVTIIDPSSMRLEALVPSDQIRQVQAGRARCSSRSAASRTRRSPARSSASSPTADPVTRQVSIFVTLPNVDGKLIAGLFAEGRVEAADAQGRRRAARRRRRDRPGADGDAHQRRQGRARRRRARPAPGRDASWSRSSSGLAAGDVAHRRLGEGRRAGHAGDSGRAKHRAAPQALTMFISDFAIRRPVITVVSMVALVVFGLVSLVAAADRRVPRRRGAARRRRRCPIRARRPTASSARSSSRSRKRSPASAASQKVTLELARQLRACWSSSSASTRTCSEATQEIRDEINGIRNDLPLEMKEPILTRVIRRTSRSSRSRSRRRR